MCVLQLKNKLACFKKEDLSIVDYVSKVATMVEEIHEVGVPLDDGELSLIVLNGLDLIYDAFVTAQMARVDNVSFISIQGLLREIENKSSKPTEQRMFAIANVTHSQYSMKP